MNILVIENDPTDLKLADAVLQHGGHCVTAASSAKEAIDAVGATTPDAIFLDLMLEGTSGLTLARTLRNRPDTQGVPIVAVTAYPAAYKREDAFDAGCDAYMVKPINTRTLADQLVEIAAHKS
jgi:CheY-like chemotaxis protein